MCLNPTQITPCAGWMTANETLRNLTSQVGRFMQKYKCEKCNCNK